MLSHAGFPQKRCHHKDSIWEVIPGNTRKGEKRRGEGSYKVCVTGQVELDPEGTDERSHRTHISGTPQARKLSRIEGPPESGDMRAVQLAKCRHRTALGSQMLSGPQCCPKLAPTRGGGMGRQGSHWSCCGRNRAKSSGFQSQNPKEEIHFPFSVMMVPELGGGGKERWEEKEAFQSWLQGGVG